MTEHLTKYDNMFYAVFAQPQGDDGAGVGAGGTDAARVTRYEGIELGEHVGSVSLKLQAGGPTLAPPVLPGRQKSVTLRTIGYAMFDGARGKGYATEANQALVDAYRALVAQEKDKGDEVFYIEGAVDEGNPGSVAVLKKLGFERVGWKEEEPVWLNGEWRSGYWVYGMYV